MYTAAAASSKENGGIALHMGGVLIKSLQYK